MNTRILTSGFEYFEPKTVKEAVDLLDRYGKDAKVLSGGSNLIVDLKLGKFNPEYVIYIGKIPELDFISKGNGAVRVGANATFSDMIKSRDMKGCGILIDALESIQIEVQKMGTIGGNLCNAAPTASSAPPLLVLGASVKVASKGGTRTIPVDVLFSGNRQTVLSPNELLIEVQIPELKDGEGAAFGEIKRKIKVAAVMSRQGDVCRSCRISLGGALEMPTRAKKAEKALEGKRFDARALDEACKAALEEIDPDAWYVREIAKDLFKKVVEKAWKEARG